MAAMEGSDPRRTTQIALAFECALGAVALVIGWLVGQWPLVGFSTLPEDSGQQVVAIGWGLVATGPLLVALVLMEQFPIGPLRGLREMTSDVILRMFGGASVAQLAAVALAAGVGEELLFRGLVQAGLARFFGLSVAVVAASAVFGVCHWLNTTYAILAMLAGAYFGLWLAATGNILTPVAAHAAYDFLALVYLVRPASLIGSK
jgi:membrane protease YdiL (CAAX protease family)